MVSVFLYSPFSSIGGVFCSARQRGGQVLKIAIYAMNVSILTLLISTHSVLNYLDVGSVWLFLKSLQEMKQKLYYVYWLKMLYITRINNLLRKK